MDVDNRESVDEVKCTVPICKNSEKVYLKTVPLKDKDTLSYYFFFSDESECVMIIYIWI